MNRRRWLVLSCGLNVLLAGVVFWAVRMRPSAVSETGLAAITNRLVRLQPILVERQTNTVAIKASFNWSQIESTDYRVYMQNLRALGCPEATIRDIIVADLDDWLARRIRELADGEMGRFWDEVVNANKVEVKRGIDSWRENLNALECERSETLKALFNDADVEFKLEEAKDRAEALASYRYWFDFLPEDKFSRIVAIKDRYRLLGHRLGEQSDRLSRDEYEKQSKQRGLQEEQEIQAQFNAQELEEYKLRMSRNRPQVPANLDVSEDEVREMTRAMASSNVNDRVRELLGPERFAEYERETGRGANLAYQSTVAFTEYFSLPEETAGRITQLWEDAEAQANRIRADQSRSAEERQVTLDGLRAETEKSISEALGPQVFTIYKKYKGGWLDGLSYVKR
jgi:hypothetical protein